MPNKILNNTLIKVLISIFVAGSLILFLQDVAKMYMADVFYKQSQRLADLGRIDRALQYSNTSVELNPLEPNYYRGRARVRIVMLASTTVVDAHPIKLQVLNDLETAVRLNPDNLVTLRNCVPLYYFLAAADLQKPGTPDNVDPAMLPEAIKFFSSVKLRFPNDVGVLTVIARYEKRLGLSEDYANTLARIRVLRPDLLEWHDSLR
jgi:tetratricopeptide (TPR) repeat protein